MSPAFTMHDFVDFGRADIQILEAPEILEALQILEHLQILEGTDDTEPKPRRCPDTCRHGGRRIASCIGPAGRHRNRRQSDHARARQPGATTVNLTVGANIVHKERIHTTPSGSVQLLFVDKSTLSIAPNTNLLIDEYVYDPKSNSGHMLTNLAEGALRFVGGALSHQGEASVTTQDAAIGIRGGTVTVEHGPNGTKVIDHFGVMTISNGAGTVTHQPARFLRDRRELEHAAKRAAARHRSRDRLLSKIVDQQARRGWRRARPHQCHHRRMRSQYAAKLQLPEPRRGIRPAPPNRTHSKPSSRRTQRASGTTATQSSGGGGYRIR